MPEAARRQREREIKLELLQETDMYTYLFFYFSIFLFCWWLSCISTLNYVGNSIFDSFSPFDINNQSNKTEKSKKLPSSALSTLFNCLIIDEAGQCIEIDNYIPLRLGMNRIILVGDPEQLYVSYSLFFILSHKLFSSPATVLSRRALEAGLNQSLFERLYKLFKYDLNNPIRMLNIVSDKRENGLSICVEIELFLFSFV